MRFCHTFMMIPVSRQLPLQGPDATIGLMPEPGFVFPWILAALPLLLLLPRQRGWLLRWGTLALLIVACAQPRISLPGGQLAVLIDVSDSVGDSGLVAARAFDFSGLHREPLFLGFAADATVLPDLTGSGSSILSRSATDIARALQVAAGSGAARILLLSDGIESAGSALQALPGVPVDSLLLERRANARLEALLLPRQSAPGQLVEGVAVVTTDRAAGVTLNVLAGSTALEPLVQLLPEGRSTLPFTFRVPELGSMLVDAYIEVDYPQPLDDDRLSSEISVSRQPPVLVIDDPAVVQLLQAQDIPVLAGTAADLQAPLGFSAIVLRGGAGQFTRGQQELLASYVNDGGGLLLTGGPDSFGFGGWFRTAVEEVLPVTTDLRTGVEIPLVAMLIILDRSQSMSAGNPSRLELAKEGAIAVVELAYHEDLLGLLAFSDVPEWIFELRPATERGKREMLAAILSLQTRGGTILGPAYEQALEVLEGSEAAIKHIIVLSDGKLYDGRSPFGGTATDFGGLARRGQRGHITTSTIAIGSDADFEQLREIALAGGGRYYEALDVTTLPRIFTSEALSATRSLLREDTFSPLALPHALSALAGDVPAIDAYVATTGKADAEVLLLGVEDEPVLSVIRSGLGRSAALTTDLNGWAGELGASADFAATLVTLMRWLQARPAAFSATVEQQGAALQVVVDGVEDGRYLDNRQLIVRYGGADTPLEQVAPGRYEGRVSAAADDGALLILDGTEVVTRVTLTGASGEFRAEGGGELLAELSKRTAGIQLTSPAGYAPDPGRQLQPVWQWPLAAALLVFLAELAARRFGRGRSSADRLARRGVGAGRQTAGR
jgi:hypothetical protein